MSGALMKDNVVGAAELRSQRRGREEAYYTIDPNDSYIEYHKQAPPAKRAAKESKARKAKNVGASAAGGPTAKAGPPMNSVHRRFKQNPQAAVREAVAQSLNPE